jgi:Tol biopolymer transport system component
MQLPRILMTTLAICLIATFHLASQSDEPPIAFTSTMQANTSNPRSGQDIWLWYPGEERFERVTSNRIQETWPVLSYNGRYIASIVYDDPRFIRIIDRQEESELRLDIPEGFGEFLQFYGATNRLLFYHQNGELLSMDFQGTLRPLATLDTGSLERCEEIKLHSANSGRWFVLATAIRVDENPMQATSDLRFYRDELWLVDRDFKIVERIAAAEREDRRVPEYIGFDISDDGNIISYGEFNAGEWKFETFVLDRRNGESRKVFDSHGAQISPSGRYLMFSGEIDGVHGIYIGESNGSNIRRITPADGSNFQSGSW